MKNVITLLLLFLGIQSFASDCSISGMYFFPVQKEISLNSMFIIQGYEMSQKTINSFRDRTVFLISQKGDTVRLCLQKALKGQMSLTQALFKPEKELQPNTAYFLRYENQTEREMREMRRWNSKQKKREQIFWKTTTRKSAPAINSNLTISFLRTEVVPLGCGPETNAVFQIKNASKSKVWYYTELVDLKTGKKHVYHINPWKEELSVGHGMCSGAFTYKSDSKYKVRFTPLNTDGKTGKTTQWYTFKSPYDNNKGALYGR